MKNLKIVLAVSLVALFTATASMAATVYTTASVKRTATTANGTSSIMMADTAATPGWAGNVWFAAPSGSDDQALATALTAMSLGKNVRIGYDDGTLALVQIGLDN